MHQAGVILEVYFRAEETMAVLVLECTDVAEANGVLASLPMVAAGLLEFEILPLRASSRFERLCGSTSAQ